MNNQKSRIDNLHEFDKIEDLSFLEWGNRRGHFEINCPEDTLTDIRARILELILKTELSRIEQELSSLIFISVNESISAGVDKIVRSPNEISGLLRAFEPAMKRWRYDDDEKRDPIKWPIKNEREVQDIIWLMMRPYYPDLQDEETLPKFGHSSYIVDFAIPSLRTLLEVKYCRKSSEFKKIEKEIMEDGIAYLANIDHYDRIIVFIYDHSCSVQDHDTTISALKQIPSIQDVIIVSRPSQLPA
jgi:hypothetical protein